MATTAKQVFDAAMGLMDEVNETTGSTDSADIKEYRQRTLLILNILNGELFPFSDTYEVERSGKRPISRPIESMESKIELDDHICRTVLPYGLAAHLLNDENPGTTGFFQQRYEELKRQLGVGMPRESEDIKDIYGGIPYCEFSRWE